MKRGYWHLVYVLLLLFAQHAAFTHAIWHARDGVEKHAHPVLGFETDYGGGRHAPQAQLCAFHLSFGQVLGTTSGKGAVLAVPPPPAQRLLQPDGSCRHVASVPPQSRSPPVFS